MRIIRRIISLKEQSGISIRQISKALNVPPSTVDDYLKRYRKSGLTPLDIQTKTSTEIYSLLFRESNKPRRKKQLPNFQNMHKELKRKHVTRQLLWEEYREQYADGYSYTQYCELYNQWKNNIIISMRQDHKAGEKMFIDYSGLTMEIIDQLTGEISKAQIYVACLGASGYTFTKAYKSQDKQDFAQGTVDALNYFGGSTDIAVPDNLKSAVIKPCRYEPDINETFLNMAEHYQMVVIPARVRRPKDKSKVELSVKLVQRWILAKLRHHQFFSITQLNIAIKPLLELLNDKDIRKLDQSRRELYEKIDKPALHPLPSQPYVYRESKQCRVNIDYHVQLEKCYYSVPYQLAGKEVRVFHSKTSVEIYFDNKRVAVHPRLFKVGSYHTISEHMSSAHRAYADWSPSRLINWGKSFGENTKKLIECILESRPHPEMGYRSCMGILNHAKKISPDIVEATSKKMLGLRSYRVGHFKEIIKNKTYQMDLPLTVVTPDSNHENVRGEEYYD
ncbi:MAG: IS21 family transposase [FCB group bacterium]|nr:IS21 family transposase [FCB group bacterium]